MQNNIIEHLYEKKDSGDKISNVLAIVKMAFNISMLLLFLDSPVFSIK
jgi:hypothetical protein